MPLDRILLETDGPYMVRNTTRTGQCDDATCPFPTNGRMPRGGACTARPRPARETDGPYIVRNTNRPMG
eukprot:878518-Prorocentrum_minimum.AAC.6